MFEQLSSSYVAIALSVGIFLCGICIYRPEAVPAILFVLLAGMGAFYEAVNIRDVSMLKAILLVLFFLILFISDLLRGFRPALFGIFLILAIILVTLFSGSWNGVNFDLLRPYLGTLCIALVTAICPNREKAAHYLLVAFAFWGIMNLVVAVLQWSGHGWAYGSNAIHTGFRPTGLMSTSTQMGIYFVLALVAVQLLFQNSEKTFMRLGLFILGIGLIIGLFGTLSRASIVAWLASSLFIQYSLKGLRLRSAGIILGATIIVFFASSFMNLDRMVISRFSAMKKDPSAQSRLALLESGIKIAANHPFLGIGLSQGSLEEKNVTLNSHNTYIQKMLEGGLLGLTIFLLVLWRALWSFWTSFASGHNPINRLYTLGLLAAMGAILINGLFHDFSYLMPLWVIIGLGLSVKPSRSYET